MFFSVFESCFCEPHHHFMNKRKAIYLHNSVGQAALEIKDKNDLYIEITSGVGMIHKKQCRCVSSLYGPSLAAENKTKSSFYKSKKGLLTQNSL